MLAWFLKLLGISSEITDHLDDASFAFQRSTMFWLGLLLIAPIGFLIYRRQQANLVSAPAALRAVLTACRVGVLVILVAVLASPYVKIDHRFEKRPIVAVLVDHSQSMNLPAGQPLYFVDDIRRAMLKVAAPPSVLGRRMLISGPE
jgi:hypothetical protein